jgi:hypothetical protein
MLAQRRHLEVLDTPTCKFGRVRAAAQHLLKEGVLFEYSHSYSLSSPCLYSALQYHINNTTASDNQHTFLFKIGHTANGENCRTQRSTAANAANKLNREQASLTRIKASADGPCIQPCKSRFSKSKQIIFGQNRLFTRNKSLLQD